MNLRKMHPADFTDLVHYMITRHMDSKEQQKYERNLWMPPKGEEPEDDNPYWGVEAEMRDFEATQRGKGVDRE